ncbi:MAG: hypothetical protein OXG51_08535 [Gammaproteobacteria bacterium]|nr:hypothetical protein [Gammaproteobacteria bacterium]MCY3794403.1 hypothetical protein [Gammaproteobacteria bacterium]
MALVSVFLLAFIEISLPLPIIFVMDGSVEAAFFTIAVAGSLGSLFFIYLSQPIRRWVVKRYGMESLIFRRTEQFMVRYGAVGVGLLAPMILGHAATAVGAVVLGAPTAKLAAWMVAGVVLWTLIYYVAFLMGGSLFGWEP